MIYKAKEISLKRAIKILDLDMINYLKIVKWFPVPLMNKKLAQFKKDFNELFNYDQISKALKEETHLLILQNKINNILPSMYQGLLLTKKDCFREHFQHLYGFWPKTLKDYQRVIEDRNRLLDKYRIAVKIQENKIDENKDQKGYELGKLVAWVEAVMEFAIDRSITLSEFRYQYNTALEKIKNLKKNG